MTTAGARVSEVLALTPVSFVDDGYDFEDACDLYGMLRDLERGIRRLRGTDIRVLAVGGSHDYNLLS